MASGLLWLLVWVMALAWLTSVVLTLPLTLFLRRQSGSPVLRCQRAVLLAALPWLAPLAAIAVALFPSMLATFGWVADHCHIHGPGHPHVCLNHLPVVGLHESQAVLFSVSLGALLIAFGVFVKRQWQGQRALHRVLPLASGASALRTITLPGPLAFTAGLRHPVIVISDNLRNILTMPQRHALLRHEIAHARAGDVLKNLLFECLLLLHLPATARQLRAIWRQALEEVADDTAAARSGATNLAEALVAVARAQLNVSGPVLAFHGADTVQRVRRLLTGNSEGIRHNSWGWIALAVLCALLAVSPAVHHDLETLLGYLVWHQH
jgi:Zn-dependent protease with chaperone function